VLGIEHIWTGYDHVLFLLALLIVTQRIASAVTIITCFTLAHSITLAVATLDLVQMPGRLVEPLIALSIVYVGVENLIRGTHPKGRWLLTFGFGLVHGFGFATVLRELGVGASSGGIWMPLLSFNLGVEIGQLAIACVVLPLLWRFHAKPVFIKRWIPALSLLVTCAGIYWLLERVFGA
jgi:hydrogenase/urease accessory protein HupE